jgi:hypothetical protein
MLGCKLGGQYRKREGNIIQSLHAEEQGTRRNKEEQGETRRNKEEQGTRRNKEEQGETRRN